MSERVDLEAEALNLGWAMCKDGPRSTFGRNGGTISVVFNENHCAIDVHAVAADEVADQVPWYDGRGDRGLVKRYLRRILREFAASYTPPGSLLDTVNEAVDGGAS